jgi:hypothetical protein
VGLAVANIVPRLMPNVWRKSEEKAIYSGSDIHAETASTLSCPHYPLYGLLLQGNLDLPMLPKHFEMMAVLSLRAGAWFVPKFGNRVFGAIEKSAAQFARTISGNSCDCFRCTPVPARPACVRSSSGPRDTRRVQLFACRRQRWLWTPCREYFTLGAQGLGRYVLKSVLGPSNSYGI